MDDGWHENCFIVCPDTWQVREFKMGTTGWWRDWMVLSHCRHKEQPILLNPEHPYWWFLTMSLCVLPKPLEPHLRSS